MKFTSFIKAFAVLGIVLINTQYIVGDCCTKLHALEQSSTTSSSSAAPAIKIKKSSHNTTTTKSAVKTIPISKNKNSTVKPTKSSTVQKQLVPRSLAASGGAGGITNISGSVNKNNRFEHIWRHLQKHSWHLAIAEASKANDAQLLRFAQLVKYANVNHHHQGLKFSEAQVFEFLRSQYPALNTNFIVGAINRQVINDTNIGSLSSNLDEMPASVSTAVNKNSAASLIAQYKKNHSILRDGGFVQKIKQFFHTKKFASTQEERSFIEHFRRVLTLADYDLRFENLLNQGNLSAALSISHKISTAKKNQAAPRLDIHSARSYSQLIAKLNYYQQRRSDIYGWLLLDGLNWCEENKLLQAKFSLLLKAQPYYDSIIVSSAAAKSSSLVQQWKKITKISIRELLGTTAAHNHQLAYKFALHHQQPAGSTEYVEGEFLAGFIAHRFLANHSLALKHLFNSYRHAQNPNRLARAAYYIGLIMRDYTPRKNYFTNALYNSPAYWFNVASKDYTTFYGQLAAGEFNPQVNPVSVHLTQLNSQHWKSVTTHPLYSYYQYALLSGNSELAGQVGKIFALSLAAKPQITVLAKLASQYKMPLISIKLGNVAKKYFNYNIIEAFYPTPNYNWRCKNPALALAIIHRESAFNPKAFSSAGACGLMQIMPGTARRLAEQIGYNLRSSMVFDPTLNTALGSQYLKNLDERYGSSLLSIISYNAGEAVADRWIKTYAHPGSLRSHYDVVAWIETVSFRETRYYMQYVMANYVIYQAILQNNKASLNLSRLLFL